MSLAACQKKKVETANPFFEEWTTPYGVPPFDRIRPEHFLPAFERGMSLHNAEIDAIVDTSDEPTFENTIAAYDASGRMLQRTSLIFEMLAASSGRAPCWTRRASAGSKRSTAICRGCR